tara:strand:- start:363 stop:548 length:186 start_codon:yes stop_codon:yes gene_type:complete
MVIVSALGSLFLKQLVETWSSNEDVWALVRDKYRGLLGYFPLRTDNGPKGITLPTNPIKIP